MDIIALLIEFVKAQGYRNSFCRNLLSCILTVMVFNIEPTISRIALFLPVNAELNTEGSICRDSCSSWMKGYSRYCSSLSGMF